MIVVQKSRASRARDMCLSAIDELNLGTGPTIWATDQKHVADTIMGVTANAQRGAQNSAFGFDQNIRGVQTFRDPTTGNTMELSNQYDHAWLNGSNEYIMSDDPNFNPNGQLNGNWNQLQAVRPAP